jgi:hypothetical protein
MIDIFWWSNHVKSRRNTDKEPVPLCDEMLDLLSQDELKDYYSRIEHLQGVELGDDEADFLKVSDWSEIIYQVKQRIEGEENAN